MKIRAFLALVSALLLSACVTKPEPEPFKIEKQKLHTKQADDGTHLFAFIVTVEKQARVKLETAKKISRSDFKRFVNEEHIEDSSSLKLALEDRAVVLLKGALQEQAYCPNGYSIDEVYWKERQVQLRGKCNE